MKKINDPGIYFIEIALIDLVYSTNAEFDSELVIPNIEMEYQFEIIEPEKVNEQRTLISVMKFNLFRRNKNWPFRLSFTLRALYHADQDSAYTLEQFAELQAPANILPYASELISNITSRGLFPTLNIPPINLHEALARGKKKRKKESQ